MVMVGGGTRTHKPSGHRFSDNNRPWAGGRRRQEIGGSSGDRRVCHFATPTVSDKQVNHEGGFLSRITLSVGPVALPRTGFEPVIFWLRTRRPRPLDERGISLVDFLEQDRTHRTVLGLQQLPEGRGGLRIGGQRPLQLFGEVAERLAHLPQVWGQMLVREELQQVLLFHVSFSSSQGA